VSKLISKSIQLLFLLQPSQKLDRIIMVQEGLVTSGNVLCLHSLGLAM